MTEDRHKYKPKSVRIRGELLAWLGGQAAAEGRKPNAVIVAALEEYRANHGGGIAQSRPQLPHEETFTDLREYSACKHPAELVEAGECRACGEDVW